jgi:hypothetical protein
MTTGAPTIKAEPPVLSATVSVADVALVIWQAEIVVSAGLFNSKPVEPVPVCTTVTPALGPKNEPEAMPMTL